MFIAVFEYISQKAMTLPFSKSVTKDSESNIYIYKLPINLSHFPRNITYKGCCISYQYM